jgi:hypothetical protein
MAQIGDDIAEKAVDGKNKKVAHDEWLKAIVIRWPGSGWFRDLWSIPVDFRRLMEVSHENRTGLCGLE